MVYLSAAVEGMVDEAVARRLVSDAGGTPRPGLWQERKEAALEAIRGYNIAAQQGLWLVLVDLDQDGDCAPDILGSWLPNPSPGMCFRIAVREVESWLMADRKQLASFLRVAVSKVPAQPDQELDPKRRMVDLARRSRNSDIREDMVPRPSSGRAIGPAYTSRLIEFVDRHWRPDVAALSSDSLRRCMQGIVKVTQSR